MRRWLILTKTDTYHRYLMTERLLKAEIASMGDKCLEVWVTQKILKMKI